MAAIADSFLAFTDECKNFLALRLTFPISYPQFRFSLRDVIFHKSYNYLYGNLMGAHSSVVGKALCYKPEGRGFDFLN
jgi:hypothetical protein